LEGDHGGDGIAGQAKDEFVAAASEDCGLAGANRDGVKEEFRAEGFENRFDEVVLSHGNAAGEDEDVMLEAELDFGAEVVDAIEGVAEGDRLASGETHLRGEGDAVAIANVKWAGRFDDGNNFVTGGKDGDAGLLGAEQIGGADLRGDREFCEAETEAGLKNQVTGMRFTSLRNDVLARLGVAIERDSVAGAAGKLNHDDGIGTGRDGGTGHDLDACAGIERN
jgi:hypothetical protein